MREEHEVGLMAGWQASHLKNHIRIKHGFAFKSQYFGSRGEYALLTPGNFEEAGGFKSQGTKQKRYEGPIPDSFVLNAGDLVVAMTEQAEGLLGSSALIPADDKYLHNQRIGLVTSSDMDHRFLFYLFHHKPVRAQISASASGTKVRHTSPSRIGEVEFLLPPKDKQHRIAGILSAYDDLIEINTRRIAILEEMARRLFDEWFMKLEVNRLPEGWRRVCLDDLVEEIRDTVLPSELPAETPYVGLEHMPRRSITLRSWGRAGEVGSTKHRFQKGDILFGKIRPYFHKVVIAPFPGVASSDAIVMRPVDYVMGTVAACLTSSDAFVAHAVQTSNGTKMPRANWNVLRKYETALPPPAMLRRFAEIVAPLFSLSSILAESSDRLRAARDLLLPKLISGEIDLERAEHESATHAERVAAE